MFISMRFPFFSSLHQNLCFLNTWTHAFKTDSSQHWNSIFSVTTGFISFNRALMETYTHSVKASNGKITLPVLKVSQNHFFQKITQCHGFRKCTLAFLHQNLKGKPLACTNLLEEKTSFENVPKKISNYSDIIKRALLSIHINTNIHIFRSDRFEVFHTSQQTFELVW